MARDAKDRTGGVPRGPENDRLYAWGQLAQLADPENLELEGDLAEVAASLDLLIANAYTSQLGAMSATDTLAALLVSRKARDQLAQHEVYLIEAARKLGATWQRLAPALELGTRQAAERRYTSLRQPIDADRFSARERLQANRDAAAEVRARRRFAMVNSHEITQLARAVTALADLETLAEQAQAAERSAAGVRAPRDPYRHLPETRIERPSRPHRLRVELAKTGGGDPSALLDALRSIPRPVLIGHGELAVLAEQAQALHRRQSVAVLHVLRRRWNRRDGLPEDYLDPDEEAEADDTDVVDAD